MGEPHGPEGRAAAEEALSLAQRVGDAATQVGALCELACIESHDGNDAPALAMLAEARSLAGQAGALRPMLHVAINESHVLEGMGEHGRAAEVARAGIASARDYGLARSTGTFLAINVAEPLVSLGRWDEAIEAIEHALALSPPRGNRLALRQLAGDVALRRGDLADARELADAASAALSRTGKQGCREAQCYLPVARLEAELFLAEGKPADARDVVTVAADRFDLVHNPRYAWPLLAVGARACAVPAVVRGPAAAERSGDLLGRLRTLAGKMDARGPVQLAGRLTFAAEAGPELADEADDGHALAQWDAAAAAWERATQPYQVAAAMLRAADAAMTAGDRDAAAERLRRAADLADQLGARPLAEEIGLFARNARLALGPAATTAAPRRARWALRPGSPRCSASSPPGGRTRRSPRSSSSPPRQPACTSRTSWPSSAWAAVVRPRPRLTGCACSTRHRCGREASFALKHRSRPPPAAPAGLAGSSA